MIIVILALSCAIVQPTEDENEILLLLPQFVKVTRVRRFFKIA
jgi:hypothetical protein